MSDQQDNPKHRLTELEQLRWQLNEQETARQALVREINTLQAGLTNLSSLFESLVKHTQPDLSVIIVAINPQGEVIYINQLGSALLGYPQEQILGQNWFANYIPARLRVEVTTVFNWLMSGKINPIKYYENPVLAAGGKEKIIAWHNTILKDEKGRIIASLSSGEDLAERTLAREERAQILKQIEATEDESE